MFHVPKTNESQSFLRYGRTNYFQWDKFTFSWKPIIAVFQYLNGAYRKDGEGLFVRERSDRMRNNGFKLQESRFRLELRKNSLL